MEGDRRSRVRLFGVAGIEERVGVEEEIRVGEEAGFGEEAGIAGGVGVGLEGGESTGA